MSKMIEQVIKKSKNHIRGKNDVYLPEVDSAARAECIMKREAEYTLNMEPRDIRIVVSLTSFPARFENLHLVIKSMLLQTMKPDQIILYLDDDVVVSENGSLDDDLPETLKDLRKNGLEIQKRPGYMKPHKKYYYAMKEHPNDIIITIDDDIMYPDNFIEELYKTHFKFQDCVVATRAHRIRFHSNGSVYPYNDWQWAYPVVNRPALDLMATGCGGVLYPPHCMHNDLFNMELFLKLSPAADDLWLKIMQVLIGTKVVITNQSVRRNRAIVPGTQEVTLNSKNVYESINDVYWRRLLEYYKLNKSDFTAGEKGEYSIGLLTPTEVNNYGTKLQAYAMQELMNKFGTVEIIRYKANFTEKLIHKPEKAFMMHYRDVKPSSEEVLNFELSAKRKKSIASFDDKFIYSPICKGRNELKDQATGYDAIVCGSDQIWNPVNLASHIFMLEFVPDNVRRIALAPSFGIESIPFALRRTYASRLKHIEYLSVREKSGVEILKNLGRDDAFWCLDPTLLVEKYKWDKIAEEATIHYDEPYVFCYFIGNNPFSREVAGRVREITGCKLVNIPHFKSYVKDDEGLADYDLYDVTPQDFVGLIRNARYVCTDSFHGTTFSLIFERELFCTERHHSGDAASTNGRLYSILSLVDLSERMIRESSIVEKLLNCPIEYKKVNVILKEKRSVSYSFIKDALERERR